MEEGAVARTGFILLRTFLGFSDSPVTGEARGAPPVLREV